jgi:hypothetical protein
MDLPVLLAVMPVQFLAVEERKPALRLTAALIPIHATLRRAPVLLAVMPVQFLVVEERKPALRLTVSFIPIPVTLKLAHLQVTAALIGKKSRRKKVFLKY